MIKSKQDWQNKMWRYYVDCPKMKAMAIDRVNELINGGCWDWDDNIPVKWAQELAKKWELIK